MEAIKKKKKEMVVSNDKTYSYEISNNFKLKYEVYIT